MPVYTVDIRFSAADLDQAARVRDSISAVLTETIALPLATYDPVEVIDVEEILRIAGEGRE